MNHLISELLPKKEGEVEITNSDPITGQAAWYDLRVKITPAAPEEEGSYPQFAAIKPLPKAKESPETVRYHTHKPVRLNRSMWDILTRGR